ncbi:MAG TPA: hypothetical protein VJN18_32390 [Polyangiaceae bacterium]|nr:hypothetical protein [Polyangiaceae bacterium]
MRISGFQVADASGRIIENPSPFQVRAALLQLIEQTGANVVNATVDGIPIAYVMAGDDDVPNATADAYTKHLVTLAENLLESAKEIRREFLNSRKGPN